MLIDVAIAKLHLRVTAPDEDALVALYTDAAEGIAQQFLNRRVLATQAEVDAAHALDAADASMLVNSDFRVAVLLILTDLYYNRGDGPSQASQGVPPKAAQAFLQPYRVEMGT